MRRQGPEDRLVAVSVLAIALLPAPMVERLYESAPGRGATFVVTLPVEHGVEDPDERGGVHDHAAVGG